MNSKYNGELCKVCGEREAKKKGMCDRCYLREYRKTHQKPKIDHRSEDTLNIIKDYAVTDGITVKQLAEKYSVSHQWVYQVLKRAGITKNKSVDR